MKKNWAIWTGGLLALGAGLYWLGRQPASVAPHQPPPAAAARTPARLPQSFSPASLEQKALSPEVAFILGHRSTFQGPRIQAVRRLTRHLSAGELEALLAYLRDPSLPPGSPVMGERVVRNDLMEALGTQDEFPCGLLATLRDVYRNPRQDGVLRDYAIQHLVAVTARQTNITAQEAQLNRQALWDAAGEIGSSIAGTALLGLHRLAQKDAAIDTSEVTAKARQVVEDPTASELARVSAIQVCAARNLTNALPTLRNLAAQDQAGIPLRISAVGALGQLGGERELALLQALQSTAGRHLQPALQAACTALAQPRNPAPLSSGKP